MNMDQYSYYNWPWYQPTVNIDSGGTSAPAASSSQLSQDSVEEDLVTANIKVLCPGGKRNDHKTFVMRDIDLRALPDIKSLKELVLERVGSNTVSATLEFDIGYFQGNKRIWLRSPEDLAELIRLLRSRGGTIWCEGLSQQDIRTTTQVKRSAPVESSDSDVEEEVQVAKSCKKKKRSAFDERLEQVDNVVDELRDRHGTKFTSIQYRVWAETINSGRHTDRDNPPRGSFWRSNTKVT